MIQQARNNCLASPATENITRHRSAKSALVRSYPSIFDPMIAIAS